MAARPTGRHPGGGGHRLTRCATRCRRPSTTPPSRPPGSTGSTSPSRWPTGRAPEALAGMRALGLGGLSVTMPHKDGRGRGLRPPQPRRRGARRGELRGARRRRARGPQHRRRRLRGAPWPPTASTPPAWPASVLGAGGAARAVALALARAGAAEVAVVNRTAARAEQAVAAARRSWAGSSSPRPPVARRGRRRTGRQRHLGGHGRPRPGRPARRPGRPPRRPGRGRPRLPAGRDRRSCARPGRGAPPAINGVRMLVHQAAVAFELWTGVTAPVAVMTASVAALDWR